MRRWCVLAAQRMCTAATDCSCFLRPAGSTTDVHSRSILEFGIASIATAAQYHDLLSLTAVFSINGGMAAQRMCTAATWPEDTLLAVLRMCTADNHSSGYYYSLVSATIKNRQRLNNQLNQENLELLFEKIDYCTAKAIELYGGQRIEGANGAICFTIRSTQCSKQHLLICLMAVYSLQQLLERLSLKLGVDLDINWALCSDNLSTVPLFSYDEGMAALKQLSAQLGDKMQEGIIGLHCREYDIEQLSSIARFVLFDNNVFILKGFPEGRQTLLEKQIMHLANICL